MIVRGIAIAAPALLIFGALLSSADVAFGKLIVDVFGFEIAEWFRHILVTFVIAAICAGFLRSLLFSGPAPTFTKPGFLRLPSAETNIAIGLIDLLFAAFVAVQFRYFFGGTSTMKVAGLTYSEYARRGFFELVAVITLALPMLLVIEWLIDKNRGTRVFRMLAAIQIALILVIAFSAYRRMQLYRDEYGLTEERLYATAFMIWLVVLLIWFAATVLTGHRAQFAAGVLATGVAAVVILHAINPDTLILRTNLARAPESKHPFDALYASMLSYDAAPVLAANAHAFDLEPCRLESYVANYVIEPPATGWRSWNLSRVRAAEAFKIHRAEMDSVARRCVRKQVSD